MRYLTFIKSGRLAWCKSPERRITGPLQAIVKPIVIARCDLDPGYVLGIVPMASGTAIGHEPVARVHEVGDGVERFKHGDGVAVLAQISCGQCTNCQRGFTGRCLTVPFGASYGIGRDGGFGCLAADLALVQVTDAMLLALPAGAIPQEWIDFADAAQDAWRDVAPQLTAPPCGRVLVSGGMPNVIGQYAAAIEVASGASEVVYYDDDPARLAQAARFGARPVPRGLAEPSGMFEVVADSYHEARSLAEAVRWVEPEGQTTSVTIHLVANTPRPLAEAHRKGLTLKLGRANCRVTMEHVCALCLSGRFAPHALATRLFAFDDAPEAWVSSDMRAVAVLEP